MRELAEKMGVEAPSLYNHIGSKSEILREICFRMANEFQNNMQQVAQMPSSEVSKTEAIIRFHIHMMMQHYDEVYVANHEWRQLEEPYLSNFLAQRKQYEQQFAGIINQGIQNGAFKNVNAQTAVLVILSAVRGLEFLNPKKKQIDIPNLTNDITNHLLKGLVQ
jgi:AcrR family transcriptional regulator